MKISRNYAVAMINYDFSGLDSIEAKQLQEFPCFNVIDWAEDSNDINGVCSISRKWDHCVEIELNRFHAL